MSPGKPAEQSRAASAQDGILTLRKALPGDVAPAGFSSETLSPQDPGLLRHHRDKTPSENQPEAAPARSASCTVGRRPWIGWCPGRKEHKARLGNSSQRSHQNASHLAEEMKAPILPKPGQGLAHSPPQSHPAPPAWSEPSLTWRKWQSRLCLNRRDSCHTGGFLCRQHPQRKASLTLHFNTNKGAREPFHYRQL